MLTTDFLEKVAVMDPYLLARMWPRRTPCVVRLKDEEAFQIWVPL